VSGLDRVRLWCMRMSISSIVSMGDHPRKPIGKLTVDNAASRLQLTICGPNYDELKPLGHLHIVNWCRRHVCQLSTIQVVTRK
jgi:hypothetical protein